MANSRRSPRARRAAAAALLSGLALLAAACAEPPASGEDGPDGALLVGRTPALARLLDRLQRIEGTPLARHARAAARALPPCALFEGRAESGRLAEVVASPTCSAPRTSALAALHRERGDRDLALALPLAGGARLLAVAAVAEAGDLEIELRLPRGALDGPRRLLLPGAEPPGPGLLSEAGVLLRARVRPEGGLDISSLVNRGGQADRLFRLKSELFAGAVLDGTWETAVYLPEPGRRMPHAALAVGFSRRELAVAAMERFVGEIQASWPVRRSFFAVGDAPGACLLDLRILPELAPCYVATGRALVIGWNPASLRKALEDGRGGGRLPEAGGLLVDFERIAEADRLLALRAAPERPLRPSALPWRRLVAAGERVGEAVHLRIRLEAGGGA